VKYPFALGAAAVSAALLVAGCGSSSTSSTSAAAPAATQATTAATTTAAATPGVTVSTKHGKLGTILAAGPKRLTVYLFESDKGSKSTCTGECASDWPPVTTTGSPTAGGGAVDADLGTITRPEGMKQVTYKGHPLYFFEEDKDNGDTNGQGSKAFGAGWYVLTPKGSKVDDDDDSSSKGDDDS
jgi:predicted lipoprotein with Yx(FWY)xxD motif